MRICACFKLLKLCKIDEARAVELMKERGVRNAETTVSIWVGHFEKNEWNRFEQRTIFGQPYEGPRPGGM